DAAMSPLLHEFKTALGKVERAGTMSNEFLSAALDGGHGDKETLPFARSQDIGDALFTVHDLERTGALWIRGNLAGQEGKVEFLQGKLVAATAGGVHGVKAIFRMFLWDEPR